MKAYKLFSRNPKGNLRSWNSRGWQSCSKIILNYKEGEWTEAKIPGTGLFCLDRIPERVSRGDELWEVEAEGPMPITYFKPIHVTSAGLVSMVKNGIRAKPKVIEELLKTFPGTVLFERVKPIQRIF